MDTHLLTSKTDKPLEPRLLDLALIPRYNTFIRVYNTPTCIVNNIALRPMPTSTLHDSTFLLLTDWRGKFLILLLMFAPVLDILLFGLAAYCLYVYYQCLTIHEQNHSSVSDPFKNMVYDHDLCFKLRKDYYAFSIQFKELQGFSLNYNRDVRKQLTLREERGKANFTIYNGNFWASYNHFGKWKPNHLLFAGLAFCFAVAVNVFFFILLF